MSGRLTYLEKSRTKLNWRELNRKLSSFSEAEVLAMLNEERAGQRRVTILERLHQRYTMLRAARERIELLQEAANGSRKV